MRRRSIIDRDKYGIPVQQMWDDNLVTVSGARKTKYEYYGKHSSSLKVTSQSCWVSSRLLCHSLACSAEMDSLSSASIAKLCMHREAA